MYSAGDIEATMTLDDSEYRKKLKDTPGAAKRAFSAIGKMAATYLTIKAGVAAIKDVVGAYVVQENAVNSVRAALRKQGEEYNLQTQALEKYAGELQNVTTYGGDAALTAMAQGMNMGIAADRIKEATKSAMGLAAVCNLDLNTAMQLVAKASAGNTAALSKYGIAIDGAKSKAEQFEEVLKKGAEGFQIAEANAQTTGGKLTSLSNAWGDLKAQVGRFVVELADVRDETGKSINQIAEATDYINGNIDRWVVSVKTAFYEIETTLKRIWATWSWVGESISAMITGFPRLVTAIGQDIMAYLKNLAAAAVNLFRNLADAIAVALTGGGTEGFSKLARDFTVDMAKAVGDIGRNFDSALAAEGVESLASRLAKIEDAGAAKQRRLLEDYAAKLDRKRQPMQDGKGGGVSAEEKRNTAGAFSSAILAGLLGANTPEQETAKNTREMVRLQRRLLDQKGGTLSYS